jgi:hypothetical protein
MFSLCFAEVGELSMSSLNLLNICPKKILNTIDSLEQDAPIEKPIPLDTVGICFDNNMYFAKYENRTSIFFLKRVIKCRDKGYCQTLSDMAKKRNKNLTKRETDSLLTLGLLYADTLIREFNKENKYSSFYYDLDSNYVELSENEVCSYHSENNERYCVKNSKGVKEFSYSRYSKFGNYSGIFIENDKAKTARAILEYSTDSTYKKLHGYYKNSDFLVEGKIYKSLVWRHLDIDLGWISANVYDYMKFVQDGEQCREYKSEDNCKYDDKKTNAKTCVNKKENKCVDKRRTWLNGELVSIAQVNKDCEIHGWYKSITCGGKWTWTCHLNGREMEDSDCRGFKKW